MFSKKIKGLVPSDKILGTLDNLIVLNTSKTKDKDFVYVVGKYEHSKLDAKILYHQDDEVNIEESKLCEECNQEYALPNNTWCYGCLEEDSAKWESIEDDKNEICGY
jgi:hypothetical protein